MRQWHFGVRLPHSLRPGPLKIGPTPDLTVPLLELCVGPSDKDVPTRTHFIDFVADGQMRGARDPPQMSQPPGTKLR